MALDRCVVLYYEKIMSARDQLLADIEAFLEQTGMKATPFGVQAAGERGFVTRLRQGGDVTLSTAERVRDFMRRWRPSPKQRRPAYQPAA